MDKIRANVYAASQLACPDWLKPVLTLVPFAAVIGFSVTLKLFGG